MTLAWIILAWGIIVGIFKLWRYMGEHENMTLGRDTPEKQARRRAAREARLRRDRRSVAMTRTEMTQAEASRWIGEKE